MRELPAKLVENLPRAKNHKLGCLCGMCRSLRTKMRKAREKKGITEQEDAYVRAVADPLSPTFRDRKASMKAAGYAKEEIEKPDADPLNRPAVKRAFLAAMEKAGITDPYLAQKLKKLLDAKKTELFAYKGEVVDRVDLEDNRIQLDAAELILRVRNELPRNDEGAGPVSLILHIPPPNSAAVITVEQWEDAARKEVERARSLPAPVVDVTVEAEESSSPDRPSEPVEPHDTPAR